MAGRTSWQLKVVQMMLILTELLIKGHCALSVSSKYLKRSQSWMSNSWHGITHLLKVQSVWNEVNIKLAVCGMTLRTNWECKSGQNEVSMEWAVMGWHYALSVSSNYSKRSQSWMSNPRHGITHHLEIQSVQNEVSIWWAAHGMGLCTIWKFEGDKAGSVLNEWLIA